MLIFEAVETQNPKNKMLGARSLCGTVVFPSCAQAIESNLGHSRNTTLAPTLPPQVPECNGSVEYHSSAVLIYV